MKKTFLAKRNALFSSANLSWGTGALAFAVFVLCVRLVAPNFFWYVFTPVFKSADAVSAAGHAFLSSFNNATALTLQNEKLVEENTALANENRALLQKESVLAALQHSSSGIVTHVIARPPTSPYDTLMLSAGSSEGVALGMEAFGAGNVPIGIVSSVLEHFSRVMLFSSPHTVLDGWVGSASTPLTLRGAGGGALQASIARSANIAAGDIVFAPGPGLLPIGKVVRVDGDPSSPGVMLRIQPTLNLFSITLVELRDTTALEGAFAVATSSPL